MLLHLQQALYDKGDYNSIIMEFGKIDWNSLFAGDNLHDDAKKTVAALQE